MQPAVRLAKEIVLEATSALAFRGPADRLARAVSIVGAPPVLLLPLIASAAWYSAASGPAVINGVLVLFVATVLMPCLFVYWLYRSGRVSNPGLPQRSERMQPAVFAVVCTLAAYPALWAAGAAPTFAQLDAGLMGQMTLLAIVTIWWKISYHAAGAAGLVAVALAWGGLTPALSAVMLALLIGWARVRLLRHTPAQVAAGWLSALPLGWWIWPG